MWDSGEKDMKGSGLLQEDSHFTGPEQEKNKSFASAKIAYHGKAKWKFL